MPKTRKSAGIKYAMFDSDRIMHSLKTALACVIGLILIREAPITADQWLVITIIVVMSAQMNVGSVIQKSYMRFLGTLSGSFLAILALILFGNDFLPTFVAVILAVLIFSYVATSKGSYSDLGTLGAVTAAIILITPSPTITMGIHRCIEISLGILIAAVVSQFVLPIHARAHLRLNQAETIRQLRAYYIKIFIPEMHAQSDSAVNVLDEKIVKSLIAQRKLATDAKRELLGAKLNVGVFKQSLRCEKEILRCICFMYFAYEALDSSKKALLKIDLLTDFHNAICDALEKIASCIEEQKRENIVLPSIAPLRNFIEQTGEHLTFDDGTYLRTFLFSIDVLLARVHKLIALVHV